MANNRKRKWKKEPDNSPKRWIEKFVIGARGRKGRVIRSTRGLE